MHDVADFCIVELLFVSVDFVTGVAGSDRLPLDCIFHTFEQNNSFPDHAFEGIYTISSDSAFFQPALPKVQVSIVVLVLQ